MRSAQARDASIYSRPEAGSASCFERAGRAARSVQHAKQVTLGRASA